MSESHANLEICINGVSFDFWFFSNLPLKIIVYCIYWPTFYNLDDEVRSSRSVRSVLNDKLSLLTSEMNDVLDEQWTLSKKSANRKYFKSNLYTISIIFVIQASLSRISVYLVWPQSSTGPLQKWNPAHRNHFKFEGLTIRTQLFEKHLHQIFEYIKQHKKNYPDIFWRAMWTVSKSNAI